MPKNNEESRNNDTEFNETKNALLRYYTSQQTSQGARLIGFTLALFTLIQTVQNSKQQPLSNIFSDLANTLTEFAQTCEIFEVLSSIIVTISFPLFFLSIFILLFFIFRTIFRFSIFAFFSDYLIKIKSCEISKTTKPIHHAIHETISDKWEKESKRVYLFFKLIWFINRDSKTSKQDRKTSRQHWIGFILCGIFAFLLSLILMLFLW